MYPSLPVKAFSEQRLVVSVVTLQEDLSTQLEEVKRTDGRRRHDQVVVCLGDAMRMHACGHLCGFIEYAQHVPTYTYRVRVWEECVHISSYKYVRCINIQ
jgi:hypothetical protein